MGAAAKTTGRVRAPKKSRLRKCTAKVMQMAADSKQSDFERSMVHRKRMRVVQLQRAVDRQVETLRMWPKHEADRPSKEPKKPHGPLRPEEWKLKGAARPAAMLARIAAGELDECGNEIAKPIETIDLLAQAEQDGTVAKMEETREYLKLLNQLAEACCSAGNTDQGIAHYEECMRLDQNDDMGSREGLVCALLDEGRGAEARTLLDQAEDAHSTTAVLAYCRVLLEYVSWEVLAESGSSEDVVRDALHAAFRLNPFIAVFLAANETFAQVVEYVEEIVKPTKPGSIEECFVYCCKNVGVWIDTVGAVAWIDKELSELPKPIAANEHCQDDMFLGMYETAVEMHQEMLAQDEDVDVSDGGDAQ